MVFRQKALHPQALLVPLQALPGPELEPQLLALLRFPRELLVLVETLALLRLPRSLELRCLLLKRLCSLRHLRLQERPDFPLRFLRTLLPPLVEVHLPIHLQLGPPLRL